MEEESTICGNSETHYKGFGRRHQQCLIMFTCMVMYFIFKSCIGVALLVVKMTESNDDHIVMKSTQKNYVQSSFLIFMNKTAVAGDAGVNFTIKANKLDVSKNESYVCDEFLPALLLIPPYPQLKWSKKIQDVVVSSFFWGYMILQIPAGQLVHRFGPRLFLVGTFTINCIVSICFPWAAYYGGWIFAAACRFVQGLSLSFIIPSLYDFFGQWAPLNERSRMFGFAIGGLTVGTVLGLLVTGYIAASPLGWPGIFTLYGILSGLLTTLIFFFMFDTPAKHPKISFAERKYIEEGLGLKEVKTKNMQIPWRHILRCKALLAIILSNISYTWGLVILFAEMPIFMNEVMHVNIQRNGLLSSLPFLVMWFTNFFHNWFTDWIIFKGYLSVTNARKMANSIGSFTAAIGLVVLAFANKTVITVEAILIFICAFNISIESGSLVTHIDIAPNFAGTMMSISNFIANVFASMAPLIAGFIVSDTSSEYQWRYVFFLTAGIYTFSNVFYCLLGSAERMHWNDPCGQGQEDDKELQPLRSEEDKTSAVNAK